MKCTVIGGKGFIGSALNFTLVEQGWDVWLAEKNDPLIYKKPLGKVFYCAGLTADFAQRPFDTVSAHVSYLNSILANADFEHLVYLSSTRVYDGLSGVVNESADLHLNPNNPRHLYDLSKLMGESLCLQSNKASVARLSCVFNNEQDASGFLPALLKQVLNSTAKEIRVKSSLNFSRDYIYLGDVVSALVAIAEGASSAIYNLASGENLVNSDLFSLIYKITGVSIIGEIESPSNSSPSIDIQRITTTFNWLPQSPVEVIEHILEAGHKRKC